MIKVKQIDLEEEYEDSIDNTLTSKRVMTRKTETSTHIYQLDYDLDLFEDVYDLIRILGSANDGDTVIISICCNGGSLEIADLIVNRIREAQNRGVAVIGDLGFTVASAATYIALSCTDLIVSDLCNFMIHPWSSGIYPKPATHVMEDATFNHSQSQTFMQKVYGNFLTKKELDALLQHPKDLHLNAEEVRKRWSLILETNTSTDDVDNIPLTDYIKLTVHETLVSHGLIKQELLPKETVEPVKTKRTRKSN